MPISGIHSRSKTYARGAARGASWAIVALLIRHVGIASVLRVCVSVFGLLAHMRQIQCARVLFFLSCRAVCVSLGVCVSVCGRFWDQAAGTASGSNICIYENTLTLCPDSCVVVYCLAISTLQLNSARSLPRHLGFQSAKCVTAVTQRTTCPHLLPLPPLCTPPCTA